jgi:hypothetical protein
VCIDTCHGERGGRREAELSGSSLARRHEDVRRSDLADLGEEGAKEGPHGFVSIK